MTDTFTQLQQNLTQAWTRHMDEQVERMTAMVDEFARLEGESAARVTAAVDEMARFTKQGLQYSLQLQEQWRRLALETARKTAGFSTPPSN